MSKIFTLLEKLFNLCYSPLSFFYLKIFGKSNVRGFQIIIIERRSEDHGEKISNEF